jgi:phage terminase small subunit
VGTADFRNGGGYVTFLQRFAGDRARTHPQTAGNILIRKIRGLKMPKLSREATKLYRKIRQEWGIQDEAGRFILETALVAFDEMRAAQAVLEREGCIVKDRFGQDKLHPLCQREKEARAHMLAAFKALNLDLESLERGDA